MVVDLYVKKAQDQARVFRSIVSDERNFAKEFENYVRATGTRPTQDNWNKFLERYKEQTKGLRNENFHDYMKLKGLTHHLSETQVIERNRENQGINAYGLMSNLAPTALTLGAMAGVNYLINRGLENGPHNAEHGSEHSITNFAPYVERQEALSGMNSHYEALPPTHIGTDRGSRYSDEGYRNRLLQQYKVDEFNKEQAYIAQEAERQKRDLIQAQRLKQQPLSEKLRDEGKFKYSGDVGL
jgi:hypothetical protein